MVSKIAEEYTELCKKRLEYDMDCYRQVRDLLDQVDEKMDIILNAIDGRHELHIIKADVEEFKNKYEYMIRILRDESLMCRFGIIAIKKQLEDSEE